jgi:hypothetical protein
MVHFMALDPDFRQDDGRYPCAALVEASACERRFSLGKMQAFHHLTA